VGGAFGLLGILVVIRSVGLSLGTPRQPGPGFVPFLLGLALIALPLLALLERRSRPASESGRGRPGSVLATAVGFGLYVLVLDRLGFYLASFLLLVLLTRVAGERRYGRAVAAAAISLLVVYLLFDRVFLIPFPPGLLGGG
jgi:hypothetical protein